MKLLRKQTDLPFLLAVGVLLILSASFLAVQLWSDGKERRGTVEALEAPVMPKAMEISRKARKKKKPGNPEIVSEKTVAPRAVIKETQNKEEIVDLEQTESVEVVDSETVVVESEELAVVAPEPKTENKKSLEKPVKAGGIKMAARPVEGAKATATVSEPVPAPADESESVVAVEDNKVSKEAVTVSEPVKAVEENVTVKEPRPARKAKKVRIAKRIEEDITVVPPEWNWFNTPLRAELRAGQVEIVAAPGFDPLPVVVEVKKTEIKKEVKSYQAKPVVLEKKTEVSVAPAVSRPFAAALARMAKIRQMRDARGKTTVRKEIVKPADMVRVSPSLRRVNDLLQQLKAKLDKVKVVGYTADTSASIDVSEYEEAAPIQYTSGGVDESEGSEGLEPYYSGSGSSFSMRINDLMRRGQLLRD